MGAAVLIPSLLSLLLVVAVARAARGEDAMIRHVASAGNNKVLGETLCCTNMTLFHECVKACFDFYPLEEDKKYCDPGCKAAYLCHTVSGDECPSPSPSGHDSTSLDLASTDSEAVGEVVQVQAAVETLCCSNMTLFHECVEACFDFFPRQEADQFCDPGCKEAYQCQTVSGDKCPTTSRHRSSSDDSSETGNDVAVGHCILGCNSSVCNKMVAGVGRKGVVKHAVESCNNACYKFCTKGVVRAGTSTA